MTEQPIKKIVIDPNKWHCAFQFPEKATEAEKQVFYETLDLSMKTGKPIELHPGMKGYQVTPKNPAAETPATEPKTEDKPAEKVEDKPAEPATKEEPAKPAEAKPVESEAKKE